MVGFYYLYYFFKKIHIVHMSDLEQYIAEEEKQQMLPNLQ